VDTQRLVIKAKVHPADCHDKEGAKLLLSPVAGQLPRMAESGAPDVVINNAGQMYVGITEAFSADELMTQLDVNLVGVHRVNRAFLPTMRKGGEGLIVNISSVAGRVALPFSGVYHASKWGLYEKFAAFGGMFEGIFSDPESPTNPALVVDWLVELVEMNPGSRPFRSVVGVDFGVRALNAAVEPYEAALLEAAGLTSFVTLRPRSSE
jgi:hypothetical protein